MYIYIILLPLFSAIICGLFGRRIGYEGAKIISVLSLGITCILSYYAFYDVGLLKNMVTITTSDWIVSKTFVVR
jgi:NADH:ubiquinone oxidoreductase subunit 5 (subunit L)/multisubunit Na+/H+ antiporter MnhA subunit